MTAEGASAGTQGKAVGGGGAPREHGLHDRVRALRETALGVVRDALGPDVGRPYALLDFPCFPNVGDNAIWLGTRTALAALGLPEPAYTCDNRTFEPEVLAQRVGDGPILLLGGGNFGDLFGKHQRLRERVASEFPRNPVLQLPQTIHFVSPAAREAARRALSGHRHLKVLVRDARSLESGTRELGLDAVLCPDLSLGLGPRAQARPRRGGIVWLARRDAWSQNPPPTTAEDVAVSDWPTERPSILRTRVRFLSSKIRRGQTRGRPMRDTLSRLYDPLARWRVERGLRFAERPAVLVTDRLHGHLLSLLTGTPHVLLDDATGKVRAFHDAWTRGLPCVRWAEDSTQALTLARELLREASPEGRSRA